jgi:hypothetical protein
MSSNAASIPSAWTCRPVWTSLMRARQHFAFVCSDALSRQKRSTNTRSISARSLTGMTLGSHLKGPAWLAPHPSLSPNEGMGSTHHPRANEGPLIVDLRVTTAASPGNPPWTVPKGPCAVPASSRKKESANPPAFDGFAAAPYGASERVRLPTQGREYKLVPTPRPPARLWPARARGLEESAASSICPIVQICDLKEFAPLDSLSPASD